MQLVIGTIMILVVVAGVAVYFLRRREKDEIHTINHYRDALTTLDDMRAPSGRTVKILSADEARELRQPHPGAVIRSEPPRSPRLSPPPGADRDLVFDDNGEPIEYPVAQTRSHFHHDCARRYRDLSWEFFGLLVEEQGASASDDDNNKDASRTDDDHDPPGSTDGPTGCDCKCGDL